MCAEDRVLEFLGRLEKRLDLFEQLDRKLDQLLSTHPSTPLSERTDPIKLSMFVRLAQHEGLTMNLHTVRSKVNGDEDLQVAACVRSQKGKTKPQWLVRPADYFKYVAEK